MACDLEKYLMDFVRERVDEVANKFEKENKQIKELTLEADKFSNSLLEELPEDKKKMFLKYETNINKQESMTLEAVYLEGIYDGIKIADTLERLKR